MSRLDALNRGQGLGDQRKEVLERVTRRREDNDAKPSQRQVLLVLEIPVSGDEDREPGSLCLREQRAILKSGPGLLLDRPDVVVLKVLRELPRQLLIE